MANIIFLHFPVAKDCRTFVGVIKPYKDYDAIQPGSVQMRSLQ